jgi:hypothetical protein
VLSVFSGIENNRRLLFKKHNQYVLKRSTHLAIEGVLHSVHHRLQTRAAVQQATLILSLRITGWQTRQLRATGGAWHWCADPFNTTQIYTAKDIAVHKLNFYAL